MPFGELGERRGVSPTCRHYSLRGDDVSRYFSHLPGVSTARKPQWKLPLLTSPFMRAAER